MPSSLASASVVLAQASASIFNCIRSLDFAIGNSTVKVETRSTSLFNNDLGGRLLDQVERCARFWVPEASGLS